MISPLGLAFFALLTDTSLPAAQPEGHVLLYARIAPQTDVLTGRWRGQEEDVTIDLEFTAKHRLLIQHGTKEVFKIFRYALHDNVLTLTAADKSISQQYYQLRGQTLTFRPKRKTPTESIDLLYSLAFHKLGL